MATLALSVSHSRIVQMKKIGFSIFLLNVFYITDLNSVLWIFVKIIIILFLIKVRTFNDSCRYLRVKVFQPVMSNQIFAREYCVCIQYLGNYFIFNEDRCFFFDSIYYSYSSNKPPNKTFAVWSWERISRQTKHANDFLSCSRVKSCFYSPATGFSLWSPSLPLSSNRPGPLDPPSRHFIGSTADRTDF